MLYLIHARRIYSFMHTRYLFLCGLFLFLLCNNAHAQTILFVDGGNTPGGNGSTWATAFTTLQQALDAATAGEQVWVKKGTYYPTVSWNTGNIRDKSFLLKSGVGLYGGFAGTETSLSQRNFINNATILSGDIGTPGDNSDNCTHVLLSMSTSNATILDGFTISDGNANLSTIYCLNGPCVNDNLGGGIYIIGSFLTINNCIFTANNSISTGGAIGTIGGTPTVNNSIFTSNSAAFGGAVHVDIQFIITNCIFYRNRASYGASLFCYGSTNLLNCNFLNSSVSSGGANAEISNYGTLNITNSIAWGYDASLPVLIQNNGSTATITYSIVQGNTAGTGNLNTDPLYINSSDPDGPDNIWRTADDGLQLQAGSPAIDTGIDAAIPGGINTDITGLARIQHGRADMGAYESFLAGLPLQILSFAAQQQANNVLLEWKTANEENTAYFIIERSTDAKPFTAVGQTNGMNVPGTHTYTFTDVGVKSIASKCYYRLKQIDQDGRFTYSPIALVSFENRIGEVFMYPNPAINQFWLRILLPAPQQVRVRVLDFTNRMVEQSVLQLPAGSTLFPCNTNRLSKGLYIAEITGNTINRRIAFVKE